MGEGSRAFTGQFRSTGLPWPCLWTFGEADRGTEDRGKVGADFQTTLRRRLGYGGSVHRPGRLERCLSMPGEVVPGTGEPNAIPDARSPPHNAERGPSLSDPATAGWTDGLDSWNMTGFVCEMSRA